MRWLIVFVFFLSLACAQAAPPAVTAEVTPMTLRPRTAAPTYIDLKLRSRVPLTGTLIVEGLGSGTVVFRQELADLTLLTSGTMQRLLLPPPFAVRAIEEVRLRFVTKDSAYDLGRFPTTGEIIATRQYVIGMCLPQIGLGEPQNFTWRGLRPERVIKEEHSRVTSVATTPVWFVPEDMPSTMGLCAFDMVVLEGMALASLNERQLGDLATWVEAGGSVCIVAARELKVEHQAFLRRMSIPDEPTAAKEHGLILRRAGLGRVAWIDAAPTGENQLMAEPWIAATYHLAHADRSYHPHEADYRSSRGYYDQAPTFEMEQQMLQVLPRTARMLPLPVLGCILAGFVLLVGPGEWIVLGKLRRRRWTWVTFPIIAAGCAFLTVRAAEHYLGTGDQLTSLIVTDFSPQGQALRENRFDLWFAGRNKDAIAEKRQALSVACANSGNYNYTRQSRPVTLPIYQGRLPAHYVLRQAVYQWTPYLQRTLTFAPPSTTSALRWDALKEMPPGWAGNTSNKAALASSGFVARKIGAEGWEVKIYHPRLPEQNGLLEHITQASPTSWTFAHSPSGDPRLIDLPLDHDIDDLIVVARRQVGQEIQIQRCVYHFDSHE